MTSHQRHGVTRSSTDRFKRCCHYCLRQCSCWYRYRSNWPGWQPLCCMPRVATTALNLLNAIPDVHSGICSTHIVTATVLNVSIHLQPSRHSAEPRVIASRFADRRTLSRQCLKRFHCSLSGHAATVGSLMQTARGSASYELDWFASEAQLTLMASCKCSLCDS